MPPDPCLPGAKCPPSWIFTFGQRLAPWPSSSCDFCEVRGCRVLSELVLPTVLPLEPTVLCPLALEHLVLWSLWPPHTKLCGVLASSLPSISHSAWTQGSLTELSPLPTTTSHGSHSSHILPFHYLSNIARGFWKSVDTGCDWGLGGHDLFTTRILSP